jgi:hypothetical protein
MLEAVPRGIFSRTYAVEDGGETLAELDVSRWREAAEVEISGRRFTLHRQGWIDGVFVLEEEGVQMVHAVKPSAFRSQFEVHVEGRVYTLRREALFSRRFGLYDGEHRVGGVEPAGVFTRRARIDLPRTWHAGIHVFVFWLVLLIWNRERRAAAG